MQLIRRTKNDNYSTISNAVLRDSNLSLKAKGFMAMVFALPEDWDFSVNGMCKILKEKKSAIYSTIAELKNAGYCVVSQERMENGRFSDNIYNFYEKPFIYKENSPLPDFPDSGNPNSENQPQYNTYINKTIIKENTTMSKQDFDTEVTSKEVASFVSLYRSILPMLRQPLQKVTMRRRNKIVTRLKEMGGLKTAEEVFRRIAASDFMTGRIKGANGSSWKPDIDWIIANDTNWVKVLEGKYDNKKQEVFFETNSINDDDDF
jgi:hypothetical protein